MFITRRRVSGCLQDSLARRQFKYSLFTKIEKDSLCIFSFCVEYKMSGMSMGESETSGVRTSLVLPCTSFDKEVQGSISELQGEYERSTRGVQTLYFSRTPSCFKKMLK